MIQLGEYNDLVVARDIASGLVLSDQQGNEVLLPGKFIPKGTKPGDKIRVFVYNDSEDRPVATTMKPKIRLHQFARLQATSITKFGAFLDWGLDKDLLVPFNEQRAKMQTGGWYVVYMYVDPQSNRLVATAKLDKFLEREELDIEEGEEVEVLIWRPSDIGLKVIINDRYEGLIYKNELFADVQPGDRRKGYIKKIREQNKIDVSLQPQGYVHRIEPNADRILQVLQEHEGFLPLTDKSDPELIRERLEMSKKTFKQAIGALYKKRLVKLEKNGIRLVR